MAFSASELLIAILSTMIIFQVQNKPPDDKKGNHKTFLTQVVDNDNHEDGSYYYWQSLCWMMMILKYMIGIQIGGIIGLLRTLGIPVLNNM